MTKSTKVTGNDSAAVDPGGTKPKPKNPGEATQKVKSGDRNNKPAEEGSRIKE